MKAILNEPARYGLIATVVAAITLKAIAVPDLRPDDSGVGEGNESTANKVVSFTGSGELIRPTGYRKWIHVGTPVTPNDLNGAAAPFPEFHNVYIDSSAFEHYESTGEFRDGTVFVKELISVGAKEASSGSGYFMGDFIGLEVALKDTTRFRDEPGNWAYFSFGHKYPLAEKARPQPASSCNECHQGDADDDWVFTQYYPVLRAAKP